MIKYMYTDKFLLIFCLIHQLGISIYLTLGTIYPKNTKSIITEKKPINVLIIAAF